MPDSEYLELISRSSDPLERFLPLANGVGVIDSGYYNNESSEGHTMFQFLNSKYEDVVIEGGERISQGISKPFLLADDNQVEAERISDLGSSGQK